MYYSDLPEVEPIVINLLFDTGESYWNENPTPPCGHASDLCTTSISIEIFSLKSFVKVIEKVIADLM
jgi:hypothetical protein